MLNCRYYHNRRTLITNKITLPIRTILRHLMPPKAASKHLTSLLSLPLVTSISRPQLTRALQAFRNDIKDDISPENPHGIPEKAVRPVGTIHLTLGVMSLVTPERVDAALAILKCLDITSLLL